MKTYDNVRINAIYLLIVTFKRSVSRIMVRENIFDLLCTNTAKRESKCCKSASASETKLNLHKSKI